MDLNDGSHRSCGVRRRISDPIPLDITLEIFSRLPTKSLVRSLWVSKLLFSTLPSFINRLATRSSARQSLLLTFQTGNKLFVFSLPQHQSPDGSYPPVDSYQMTNPKDWSFTQLESIHGLIFLSSLKIWNPTMRRSFSLPKPKSNGVYLLAYEPLEGKHKVLCISHDISRHPIVLTLGSACESWRNIKDCPMHSHTHSSKCINGVLYYKAFFVGDRSYYAIMSFHAKSEKFKMIKFPEDYISGSIMVPYEGRLALVTSKFPENVDLWILKDADRHEWTHTSFLLPLSTIDTIWQNDVVLIGVTEDGELIYVPKAFSGSLCILYVDLRRNNIREALFEEILGDDFRRKNSLGDGLIEDMNIFPNHINSLVTCWEVTLMNVSTHWMIISKLFLGFIEKS